MVEQERPHSSHEHEGVGFPSAEQVTEIFCAPFKYNAPFREV